MSLDFTHDYCDHTLVNNKNKYTKIYKLVQVEASDVKQGDVVMIETPCGRNELYIATQDSTDSTLHLSKYSSNEFIKAE